MGAMNFQEVCTLALSKTTIAKCLKAQLDLVFLVVFAQPLFWLLTPTIRVYSLLGSPLEFGQKHPKTLLKGMTPTIPTALFQLL